MLPPRRLRDRRGVAVRMLNGEIPETIKTPALGASTPKYDWRELQRWKISEARLPPDSIVQFRQPTIWQSYLAGRSCFCQPRSWSRPP